MKKFAIFLAVLTLSAPARSQTAADRQKADALLKQMTLDEKIGQMTQVSLGVVGTEQDGVLNPQALKKAIQDYKVGSILNVTNHALTAGQWRGLIKEMQDEARQTRLKIPIIYGLDGIHGQTYTLDATLFPQNIGVAATREPELAAAAARVTALELRASGVRWNFAPVLECGRQPLWSRFAETYGEDVYICKTMGVAAIRAYQADGLRSPTAVAACMKHYLAYSASRTGKDRTPIYLPDNEMREYYLPQFRAAVQAGAATLMVNSADINGTPVHASKYLLTDVLRKELGFEGVVVSDWEDIIRLHTRHFVAATPRQAVVLAVNAGVDMSMVPSDFSFFDLLKEAVQKGEVSVSRIDEAVRRILILKLRLGLFENPYAEDAAAANFGKPEYQALALRAAREAMTLLKNDHEALPLSRNAKILVAGPAAQSISALNGCWSYTWQGKEEQWYPRDSRTILQAVSDKLGAGHVVTSTGPGFDNPLNYDTARLRAAAAGVDAIVLCLGENAYAESPGVIPDLALADNQVILAKVAVSTGKPVILVLSEGRPRLISGIAPEASAILMAYWSGKKSAEAISDVLFGDYNPDGVLPFSYPRSMGEMVLYDRKPTEDIREIFNSDVTMDGYRPLYPFGWGLSYTHFEYGDLQLGSGKLQGNEKLTVTITVKNTGSRDGKHTVELYSHQLYASTTPNMQRLRAFKKISLKAGEQQTVSFTIDKNDLAFVNAESKTVTEPGEFELMIGNRKGHFTYVQ
ncbi:MAG: glycoside hydrolase family 3 N-terminal domain-containing protein [Bacteroidota bacterium]|nr:glycoside hydrolase family 3 N-terminal domain-containing protein [Bacteroidota bacterium]